MSDNIIRIPNATQEPSDLYRLTLPQSLHWDSRIANAPRTMRWTQNPGHEVAKTKL